MIETKSFVLTERVSKTRERVCWKCGKPFKVGEEVLAKQTTRDAKHYHPSCYEEMFLDL